MGSQDGAICNKCGHSFTIYDGGGFDFHMLHCDRCGRERLIKFEEIGEPHLRYLKGLGGPYSTATAATDAYVQKNYPGEPLSREDYRRAVEEIAGKHDCGGHFRFDAPARCPKCRSTDHRDDPGGDGALYD